MKKSLIVGGVVIVALFILFYFLGVYGEKITLWMENQRQEAIYNRLVVEPRQKLEEAYKKDTMGSTTPEGTLDMFIAALKKNNLEEASKYYVVEMQEKQKESLRSVFESEEKKSFMFNYLTVVRDSGFKKCEKYIGSNGPGIIKEVCFFTSVHVTTEAATSSSVIAGREYSFTTPAGSKENWSVGFVLNPYKNIWKIEN
ncbi:MAG: hypothetical protein WC757_01175 [Candidatus Paceibacterota bacterium]